MRFRKLATARGNRMPILDPDSLSKGRSTLVTRHLHDFEVSAIGIDRAQRVIIPTKFIDGLWSEGHPTLVSPTEKALMQPALVERHRTYLSVLVW